MEPTSSVWTRIQQNKFSWLLKLKSPPRPEAYFAKVLSVDFKDDRRLEEAEWWDQPVIQNLRKSVTICGQKAELFSV
jgi:hypothetical protein